LYPLIQVILALYSVYKETRYSKTESIVLCCWSGL